MRRQSSERFCRQNLLHFLIIFSIFFIEKDFFLSFVYVLKGNSKYKNALLLFLYLILYLLNFFGI